MSMPAPMRARASVLVFTLAIAGCGTSPTPLRDVGPVDATERTEAARSLSFLLTHFGHPAGPFADGTVMGVDLDERVSAGDAEAGDCRDRHPDRRSPLGVDGVDNQVFAAILPYARERGGVITSDPQRASDEPILSGARLHVVRVGELDDLRDDPDVRVEILVVERPGCGGATCPLGEVTEGEVFVERARPIADVRGTIVDGRLRFSFASYLVDSEAIGTPIHDARVDVAIDEHGLEGAIGGGLDVDELVAWSTRFMECIDGSCYEQSRELHRTFSDLSPSPLDPAICDRISVGLEVEATRVFVPFGER